MLYSPQKDAPIKTGTREGSGLDSGKGNEVRKGSQLKKISGERDLLGGGGGEGGCSLATSTLN